MRSISGYTPKEKTDTEKVERCNKEIKRLENLLDIQKRILASAEKRLAIQGHARSSGNLCRHSTCTVCKK